MPGLEKKKKLVGIVEKNACLVLLIKKRLHLTIKTKKGFLEKQILSNII